jgi:glycogen debranching enzyme
MSIILDRSICCDLNETISREWLITNGLGGYAAGTVAGTLTRTQHGLLVTIPPGSVTPQLLLAKIDEEVVFDQRIYYLGTNEYRDGTLKPSGYLHLETFHLENGNPVFTYRLGGIEGILLEKRIWMLPGENTTYIQYQVISTDPLAKKQYQDHEFKEQNLDITQKALEITLLPFTAYRSYDQLQPSSVYQGWQVQVRRPDDTYELAPWQRVLLPGSTACTLQAGPMAHPYHIVAIGHPHSEVNFIPTGVWYWNFLRRCDAAAGLPATDDLYLPGVIRAKLWAGATLTVLASSDALTTLAFHQHQIKRSYDEYIERRNYSFQRIIQPHQYQENDQQPGICPHHHKRILPFTTTPDPHEGGEEYLQSLFQAGEHFLLCHPSTPLEQRNIFQNGRCAGTSIIRSSYYEMENRTRDALIALPGLMLVTEHYDDARNLLGELARHFKAGLLPDHLPLPGCQVYDDDYNSVDTTLWYFYALDHYLQRTHDYGFLEELYGELKRAIDAYIQGINEGISLDPNDGLLYAYQPGEALTWMNAIIYDLPVTQRGGKPVEVNALWYHALSLLDEWSLHKNRGAFNGSYHRQLRELCKRSFQKRFWYEKGGYLYDVIDGPTGDDAALRPNQLLALSLRFPILDASYWHSVYETVTQHLLTPYGLRTLAPFDKNYRGKASENPYDHKRALHQGSIIPWLLGPYVDAILNLQGQSIEPALRQNDSLFLEYLWRKGQRLLEPFKERLSVGLLGMYVGALDGDAPYAARLCEASALSTGELLRVYDMLTRLRTPHLQQTLSH